MCSVPGGGGRGLVPLGEEGGVSTVGIMSTVEGYLEYRGECSVPWGDTMINVMGYPSTGGVFSTVTYMYNHPV